jgi:hypothetical protein
MTQDELMPYMQMPMIEHPLWDQMSPAMEGLTPPMTMPSSQPWTRS